MQVTWVALSSALSLVACASGASFARPAKIERLPPLSPFYAHGDVGLGIPEGLAGGGLGVSPSAWSSAEIGVGMSDSGPQAALMLGLHVPVSAPATIGVSSGVSIGRNSISQGPRFDSEDPVYLKVWDWMLWSNTELTIRHRIDKQTLLRFDAGVAASLAWATPACKPPNEPECVAVARRNFVPYVGFGVEQHF